MSTPDANRAHCDGSCGACVACWARERQLLYDCLFRAARQLAELRESMSRGAQTAAALMRQLGGPTTPKTR